MNIELVLLKKGYHVAVKTKNSVVTEVHFYSTTGRTVFNTPLPIDVKISVFAARHRSKAIEAAILHCMEQDSIEQL